MTPRQLQALYEKGQNIIELLRHSAGTSENAEAMIEIAYDLQAGSYIAAMETEEYRRHKIQYTAEISRLITRLGEVSTILEAGVGEATTLSGVLRNLGSGAPRAYGFDLSWSRIAYAGRWLREQDVSDVTLCTGSLFHIPFCDNSIDIVYTSHSIEPNGGNEKPILQELYRVARRYLILLEPGYELAGDEARRRMDRHGYCKNLRTISEDLGYEVLEHVMFPVTANPLNPTALTLIRKRNASERHGGEVLACPKFRTPLERIGQYLYSPEALVIYPVVENIPCLRIENGIIASKLPNLIHAVR